MSTPSAVPTKLIATTDDPYFLALHYLNTVFPGDRGPGLWCYKGQFLAWYGTSWRTIDRELIEDQIFRALAATRIPADDSAEKSIPISRRFVDEVVRSLEVHTRAPWRSLPTWTSPTPSHPPSSTCIGLQDTVVSCHNGTLALIPRDSTWLDPCIVPVSYDPEALCPRWHQCLSEWSLNDPAWIALLQRWLGYCLMGTRKYERWLLLYGKVRGGKGTIGRILEAMLGRGQGVSSKSFRVLLDKNGLWGLQSARVLRIGEIYHLERGKHSACSLIKQLVGRDPVEIGQKYIRSVQSTVCPCAIMAESNELPNLADEAQGLSSKMLVLPFNRSFLHQEEFDLYETLLTELPGIVHWAIQGALALEAETDPTLKWPEPLGSSEVRQDYKQTVNVFEDFLESRCVRTLKGRVRYDMLYAEWIDFRKRNLIKGHDVAPQWLGHHLKTKTSWDLETKRHMIEGNKSRFVYGLSLRRRGDEQDIH